MEQHIYSEQELKFTAMLYANYEPVIKSLNEIGKLPNELELGGVSIAIHVRESERGRDIVLTEKERMVYDAIKRERRLPGGGALIFTDSAIIFDMHPQENILWRKDN